MRLTAKERKLAKELEVDKLIHGRYQTQWWSDYEKQVYAAYQDEKRKKNKL